MIKENKGLTEVKGSKRLIYCEFSTIAFELLNNGFRKEELQRALDEAVEYTEKGPEKIHEERKNKIKSIMKKMDRLFKSKDDEEDENEDTEDSEIEEKIEKILDDIVETLEETILKND